MRAVLLVCAVVTLSALAACGGDDDLAPGETDARIGRISGVAEAATYAYAATGGEGLRDYLASDFAAHCTAADIKRALAQQPVPTGFKMIKDVQFGGESKAKAMVVVKTANGEKEQEWSFVREGDDSWRILSMPSLSEGDCPG